MSQAEETNYAKSSGGKKEMEVSYEEKQERSKEKLEKLGGFMCECNDYTTVPKDCT